MCVDGPTRGLPHSRYGAESICYMSGRKSVVVQVTDSCPCDYPSNAASNRQWCCGDMVRFPGKRCSQREAQAQAGHGAC